MRSNSGEARSEKLSGLRNPALEIYGSTATTRAWDLYICLNTVLDVLMDYTSAGVRTKDVSGSTKMPHTGP